MIFLIIFLRLTFNQKLILCVVCRLVMFIWVYLITYFFNVDYLSNVIYLTLDESMLFLILYVDNFNVMLKIFKSEF